MTSSCVAYVELNLAPLSTDTCMDVIYVICYTSIFTTGICMHIHQDLLILSVHPVWCGCFVIFANKYIQHHVWVAASYLEAALPSACELAFVKRVSQAFIRQLGTLFCIPCKPKTSPNLCCNHQEGKLRPTVCVGVCIICMQSTTETSLAWEIY